MSLYEKGVQLQDGPLFHSESMHEPLLNQSYSDFGDKGPNLSRMYGSVNYDEIEDDDSYIGRLNKSRNLMGPKRKFQSNLTFKVEELAHRRYRSFVKQRVTWTFIFIIALLIERLFTVRLYEMENDIIYKIQLKLGLNTPDPEGELAAASILSYYQFSVLVFLHVYAALFYMKGPVIALKILVMHFLSIAIICTLQIILQDPRPYWDDPRIAAANCPNSYPFPSFASFSYIFLYSYGSYCLNANKYDDKKKVTRFLRRILFYTLLIALCSYEVISGYLYIYQLVFSIGYVVLFYFVITSFDTSISIIMEKSSLDIQSAKRYTIFWLVVILLMIMFMTIIYRESNIYVDTDWYQNYFTCIQEYHELKAAQDVPYRNLLGAWGSFLKTTVVYLALGAIFGTAKTFRDFEGQLWFKTDFADKVKMTLFSWICIAPSWVLIVYQFEYTGGVSSSGVGTYIITAFHYICLGYFIFGVLPYHVFRRCMWTNRERRMTFVK